MSTEPRRPQKGITADMWDYFDKRPNATAHQRAQYAENKSWNPSTLSIQYKAWHVFTHGAPPPSTGPARVRKTPGEKAAEKEAKRLAREARKAGPRKAAAAEKQVGSGVAPAVPQPVKPAFSVKKHPRACSCGGFEYLGSRRCYYCDGRLGELQDGTRAERPAVEYIAHPDNGNGPFAVSHNVETAKTLLFQRTQVVDRSLPETSGRRWNGPRKYVVHALRRGEYIDRFGRHSAGAEPVFQGEM